MVVGVVGVVLVVSGWRWMECVVWKVREMAKGEVHVEVENGEKTRGWRRRLPEMTSTKIRGELQALRTSGRECSMGGEWCVTMDFNTE